MGRPGKEKPVKKLKKPKKSFNPTPPILVRIEFIHKKIILKALG
jgi:hypothetical protein